MAGTAASPAALQTLAACLQDGTTGQGVDSVLYCTGYQYAYPWLTPPDLLKTDGMRIDPLYMHVLHPAVAPTLAFVGLLWKNVPYPQMEMQARAMTALSARCCCWLCLTRAAHSMTTHSQLCSEFQREGAVCVSHARLLLFTAQCVACQQMSRRDVFLCPHASACFARDACTVQGSICSPLADMAGAMK